MSAPSHPETPHGHRRPEKRRDVTGDSDELHDTDATPRPPPPPPQAMSISVSLSNATNSETTSTTSSRGRAGGGSPRKRLRNLANREDGIARQPFPLSSSSRRLLTHPFPDELCHVLDTMIRINNSEAILPAHPGGQILADAASQGIYIPRHAVGSDSDATNTPPSYCGLGPTTPSLDAVVDIVSWAAELQVTGADEPAWNALVHARLLCLALYPHARPRRQLVGLTPCTTAGIIREYVSLAAGDKKVDFCLHIDPSADDDGVDNDKDRSTAAARIERRLLTLPLNSINHTDYDPLAGRPIAVSIETKRPDADRAADAQLQVGVWHMAQWKLLESLLVSVPPSPQNQQQQYEDTGEEEEGRVSQGPQVPEDLRPPRHSLPSFLPAVIIKGHDWYFAATTRSGRKTVCCLLPCCPPLFYSPARQ